MGVETLEFRKVSPEFQRALEVFFVDLEECGIGKFFHPHPLSGTEARRLSEYDGRDLYYVAVRGNRVLGYGFLRGWEEGYSIPSLGIAVHPSAQGYGLGRAFMHFLHVAAWQRGAIKVRLRVYPDNAPAVNLYASLGYIFQPVQEQGQLVGVVELV